MILTIEGIDGSGKTVQTNLLKKYFKQQNKKFIELSFPDYDSFSGEQIGTMLSGKNDLLNANKMDVKSICLWFAFDRYLKFKNIDIKKYDFILINRYTLSNAVYQSLNLDDEIEKQALVQWIFDLEFNKFNLPMPDITFILDVNLNIYKNNILNKGFRSYIGNDLDIYESNIEKISKAKNSYINFSKQLNNTFLINCMDDNNVENMKNEIEIHKNIINIINKKSIE